MVYVAAALAVALTVTVAAFIRLIQSMQRSHARREDALINQLLHATGRPWQPAPADTYTPPPASNDGESEQPPYVLWTTSPEQEP